MAQGIRNKTTCHDATTTWGLSMTGVAQPRRKMTNRVGMAYIRIADEEHSEVFGPFHF
jgi:nicotinamide mononucleotide (NMN) deamidase PncC